MYHIRRGHMKSLSTIWHKCLKHYGADGINDMATLGVKDIVSIVDGMNEDQCERLLIDAVLSFENKHPRDLSLQNVMAAITGLHEKMSTELSQTREEILRMQLKNAQAAIANMRKIKGPPSDSQP